MYSKCKECGHVEPGVCGVMFGHRCDKCGAIDAAVIRRKKEAQP